MASEVGLSNMFYGDHFDESGSAAAIAAVFAQLGVSTGSGFEIDQPRHRVAKARKVEQNGRVWGRVEGPDERNTAVTIDAEGMPTVVSTDDSVVPLRRAQDIERGMRAFILGNGWLGAHELGHYLGLVSTRLPVETTAEALDPKPDLVTYIQVGNTRVEAPHNGTQEGHNVGTQATFLMDDGGTFDTRTVVGIFSQPTFSGPNRRYLEDILPSEP